MHTIRLGPPWQRCATAGGMRHARKFGSPRTLDANEQLWLVCEQIPAAAILRLNGETLTTIEAAGSVALDITSRLQPRNEVLIDVQTDAPLGEVRLEVRTV
ncbi:MAG: hypothetical protein RMJ56_12955 [Gemmataceae bacterium]|nr:hypothetical protein [Gemmata sp.]MDW8198504.1 hypothetical protein [Gemmataceae bacterium]